MPEALDPVLAETLEMLVLKVRDASRSGKVIQLSKVWPGSENEFIGLSQVQGGTEFRDIKLIGESGQTYVYSELHMTLSYAEAAALACDTDVCHIIAETVRRDSRTYPRPTPVAVFEAPPFLLSRDTISKAVEEISGIRTYSDIRLLRTSDESLFLYSSLHMNPDHARSVAEWIAVGQLQNP
jgi:hypothetical protein